MLNRRSARRREAGFSLIEIVVAFALVAAALLILLPGFAGSLGGADSARRYQMALALAESKLAESGVLTRIEVGTQTGEAEGGFDWRREVKRGESASAGGEPQPVRAYLVNVTVSWGNARRVDLATTLLAAEPGR